MANNKQGTAADADAAVPAARRGRQKVGHELRAATAAARQEEVDTALHECRFALIELVAYHAIREQFLARLSRFLTGGQVFLGTAAMAAIADVVPGATIPLLVCSSLAGVVLLVVDPAGGARDHRALRSRLHNNLALLEENGAAGLPSVNADLHRLRGEAPPAYRIVQAEAYNTAVNATYDGDEAARYRYRIGLIRRMLANWLPMRGAEIHRDAPVA